MAYHELPEFPMGGHKRTLSLPTVISIGWSRGPQATDPELTDEIGHVPLTRRGSDRSSGYHTESDSGEMTHEGASKRSSPSQTIITGAVSNVEMGQKHLPRHIDGTSQHHVNDGTSLHSSQLLAPPAISTVCATTTAASYGYLLYDDPESMHRDPRTVNTGSVSQLPTHDENPLQGHYSLPPPADPVWTVSCALLETLELYIDANAHRDNTLQRTTRFYRLDISQTSLSASNRLAEGRTLTVREANSVTELQLARFTTILNPQSGALQRIFMLAGIIAYTVQIAGWHATGATSAQQAPRTLFLGQPPPVRGGEFIKAVLTARLTADGQYIHVSIQVPWDNRQDAPVMRSQKRINWQVSKASSGPAHTFFRPNMPSNPSSAALGNSSTDTDIPSRLSPPEPDLKVVTLTFERILVGYVAIKPARDVKAIWYTLGIYHTEGPENGGEGRLLRAVYIREETSFSAAHRKTTDPAVHFIWAKDTELNFGNADWFAGMAGVIMKSIPEGGFTGVRKLPLSPEQFAGGNLSDASMIVKRASNSVEGGPSVSVTTSIRVRWTLDT